MNSFHIYSTKSTSSIDPYLRDLTCVAIFNFATNVMTHDSILFQVWLLISANIYNNELPVWQINVPFIFKKLFINVLVQNAMNPLNHEVRFYIDGNCLGASLTKHYAP